MHLTLISYPAKLDSIFEQIAFEATPVRKQRAFARCQTGTQLHSAVTDVVFDVTLLDLVGHNGEKEGFMMGDEVLLQAGKESSATLDELNKKLPRDATVRILGCETGVGDKGLEWLRSVSKALDDREVLGTRCWLISRDFSEGGLNPHFPKEWFVSSRDAKSSERFYRGEVAPEDEGIARRWEANLPAGYRAMGRGRPLVRTKHRMPCRDVTLKLAFNNRLALIDDGTRREPLMLQWTRSGRAPFWSHLLVPFTAQ